MDCDSESLFLGHKSVCARLNREAEFFKKKIYSTPQLWVFGTAGEVLLGAPVCRSAWPEACLPFLFSSLLMYSWSALTVAPGPPTGRPHLEFHALPVALAWPSPGCLEHFGSESVGGTSSSLFWKVLGVSPTFPGQTVMMGWLGVGVMCRGHLKAQLPVSSGPGYGEGVTQGSLAHVCLLGRAALFTWCSWL